MAAFLEKLDAAAKKNNSLLCIGLDLDLSRIPASQASSGSAIFDFNCRIIDKTKDLACAYKPNCAFYEMYGLYGLEALIKTIEYIPKHIPVILDAKRGDIGNSSAAYAKACFDIFKADAVTVNPYMGLDSIEPFLEYKDKGIFILCLTSNPGSADFQKFNARLRPDNATPLFKKVAEEVKKWDRNNNCGLVVGATQGQDLKAIREIVKDMPILIPGVGPQGGSLREAVSLGANAKGERAIINSSRQIIYAKNPAEEAKKLRDEINKYRWRK